MIAQTKTAEPNIVNGINVDDLFALIEASSGTPQKARQTGASPRPGRARPTAARRSRASRSAANSAAPVLDRHRRALRIGRLEPVRQSAGTSDSRRSTPA